LLGKLDRVTATLVKVVRWCASRAAGSLPAARDIALALALEPRSSVGRWRGDFLVP
jgi:hypothetical protein